MIAFTLGALTGLAILAHLEHKKRMEKLDELDVMDSIYLRTIAEKVSEIAARK